ncbi:galactose-binding domain-like protein [Crepidotus variabilis]|uniref:Galactose-binding domain-like protein n=1 Tax=Crepidotus variabilis TaxID=179855 RepID=A0A9P6ENF7_9AGAR|nr:galactose-binding domain-like protein [Crepidotus variabilis]
MQANSLLESLVDSTTLIKVSSTLDKSNGKKNLIDGSPETCWASQQGLPQYIQLTFVDKILPKRLMITFQGGFVGTRCTLQIPVAETAAKGWTTFATVYPEDVNRQQVFELKPSDSDVLEEGTSIIKFVFEESSDFFGRITIYDLRLEGIQVQ